MFLCTVTLGTLPAPLAVEAQGRGRCIAPAYLSRHILATAKALGVSMRQSVLLCADG
jgi:hypothetical protein